jgi:hypothetical protein
VLKAIRIEADPIYGAGLSYCDLTNCTIAKTPSTIAIDDRVSITLTPAALNFGDVIIATLEPETPLLILVGLLLLGLVRGRNASRFPTLQGEMG